MESMSTRAKINVGIVVYIIAFWALAGAELEAGQPYLFLLILVGAGWLGLQLAGALLFYSLRAGAKAIKEGMGAEEATRGG